MPQTTQALQASRPNRLYPLSRQSHFIGLLCLASLISIFLARIFSLPFMVPIPHGAFLAPLLTSILVFKRSPKVGRLLIIITCTSFLYLNSSNFIRSLDIYRELFGQELVLTATVQDDAAYNNYGDYEFNVTNIHFASDGEYLPGRVRVRTKQNAAVYRGDRLLISGKIRTALGARTGSISYANVEVIESEPTKLEELRLKFFTAVYSSLPEPHASLGIGFLAGVRSSISKAFQDQLSRVGLTHIIAVSGYNLTILVLAIGKLGKRLSKYQRLIISLGLIMTFLLITGFSPSVVRAAVVCLISLTCTFFGRKISPLNLILISAALTAGVNPTYLWEDIGWWLSFLAFFGVLILAPAIVTLIYKEREPGIIIAIIIESLSAQILTAPLIAHIFGTFSLISLLANALVIPWIPFIMLLVFLVGAVGIFNPHLSVYIAQFPKIVLTPIILIIERLSSLPWASVQLKLSQAGMLISYILIATFIKLTNSRSSRKLDGG